MPPMKWDETQKTNEFFQQTAKNNNFFCCHLNQKKKFKTGQRDL